MENKYAGQDPVFGGIIEDIRKSAGGAYTGVVLIFSPVAEILDPKLRRICFEEGIRAVEQCLKNLELQAQYYNSQEIKGRQLAAWALCGGADRLEPALSVIKTAHPLGSNFILTLVNGKNQWVKVEANNMDFRQQHKPCNKVTAFVQDLLSREAASIAAKALLYEVCVSPKPGLVDRLDSGAHRDMDLFTFIDSTTALLDYFKDITSFAAGHTHIAPSSLLGYLRYYGVTAEKRMLDATAGVNTHKGAVFSMGIICAAIGYLFGSRQYITVDRALAFSGEIAAASLQDFKGRNNATSGETLYNRHGIMGARGEAAAGFPTVKNIGLPLLEKLADSGLCLNDAGVITLLGLISQVEDTNIISRSDRATAKQVREMAASLVLKSESMPYGGMLEDIEQMNRVLVELNISPGGSADLLAVTFLCYFLKRAPLYGNGYEKYWL